MVGQFRQSVFGRLGGYDDVNDADRLSLDLRDLDKHRFARSVLLCRTSTQLTSPKIEGTN